MGERQETVDDIIAEARDKYTVHECNQCAWRKCCSKGFGSEECGKRRESIWLKLGIEDGYFTQLLDRLEAAHKREHGNSVALREALKAAELGLFRWLSGSISRDEHRELVVTIKTALAAPARNCDVGDAADWEKRFGEECDKGHICSDCPVRYAKTRMAIELDRGARCEFVWAQMPYAEGGAK